MLRALRAAALAALGPWLVSSCGEPASRGAELYATMGCIACHGPQGEGSPNAPPLRGVGSRWTEADLVAYLADPPAYAARDPRLAEQAGRFPQLMPPYGSLAPSDLAALARFVLAWADAPH